MRAGSDEDVHTLAALRFGEPGLPPERQARLLDARRGWRDR